MGQRKQSAYGRIGTLRKVEIQEIQMEPINEKRGDG